MAKWKVAGVNFDHIHMGDLLREVHNHPDAEIVGICDVDPGRMQDAIDNFGIPADRVYTDLEKCLAETKPDLVILCPATAEHADWVERVAPAGVHVLMEKPFAASIADADRMIAAVEKTGKLLAINWPLAWYPAHRTAKRLVDEGTIGDVIEVHFYDGNRGPLYHLADKVEVSDEDVIKGKPHSWFYKESAGGGSMLDYVGYGVTLGTWFLNGEAPIEVTCVMDEPEGLEVDEHSVTVCRYKSGLSKFETRWGTFTDPWTLQPQPKCGFVLVGTKGTISSYDFEPHVTVQTRERREQHTVPVDTLQAPRRSPVEYVLHLLESGEAISGPLDPKLARVGQQITDSAVLSAREKRTVRLLP
ncbi:MAG: Gfo/Idh/MocA family oxidoreductase [Mesorhizobium sp.]|nr:Gfo/Idh/MocA family oxidoreductase [Mesorhizobium sp.]MBL8575735.1 Gfo/Idh/MocA family oxidoreductase [Mesorhizobium sp.]